MDVSKISKVMFLRRGNYFSKGLNLLKLAVRDSRDNVIRRIGSGKPKVINFFVNNICNARCQMCFVWKNKKNEEISPGDLEVLLKDDLFSDIQYVGVNGGEPTLRQDLVEIFKVLCSKTPKMRGVGLITNGIQGDVAKEKILECWKICCQNEIKFDLMISLDGIGDVHDAVRGSKGSFDSAVRLLKYFHNQTPIDTSFGCTLTNLNVWHVDEFLDYVKKEGFRGRFRIAEFINRLGNQEQRQVIRNFDDRMKYHLGLFFFRLEHDFEKNAMIQKTYRNIRRMIAEDKPRQIGCPYQSEAICLTSTGSLLYCSPKSPVLGNALQSSPKSIYFSNIPKRKEIIETYCSQCVHDYHVPVTFLERFSSLIEKAKRKLKYNLKTLDVLVARTIKKKKKVFDLSNIRSRKVLIVGWYGTETAGDKANLWKIIENLRSRPVPPEAIDLASLAPFISRRTIKEMDLGNVSIVETYTKAFEKACEDADEIVVGGGPLMDLSHLDHILYAFIRASRRNVLTRIEGCGIGPLVVPRYVRAVAEILKLSDHINLRDSNSLERCRKEFGCNNADMSVEPAVGYVEFIKKSLKQEKNHKVVCFLRDWTPEYVGRERKKEGEEMKAKFESQLPEFIKELAKGREILLLPMHTFFWGGDDRVFNRQVSTQIQAQAEKEPLTPLEILQHMQNAELNICMRYHSVVFAETLGVPYIAIDYTNGGKIRAFLKDRGKLDRLITSQVIAEGKWRDFRDHCQF